MMVEEGTNLIGQAEADKQILSYVCGAQAICDEVCTQEWYKEN